MKYRNIIIAAILLFTFDKIIADDFLRNLPKPELVKTITPEKFPNNDAVIMLKEQSYQVQYGNFDVDGDEVFGPGTIYTKIMIVKLFNESAVERYGSFEFEYIEKFGNKLKNRLEARARVLKENGNIEVLDEDEIKTIVSRKDEHDKPLARKVLFKIPNLKPGDVVQIEYRYDDLLAYSPSQVFYYNDVDYVLYSNVYLTLLADQKFKIFSSPQNKIGNPQVQQISQKAFSGQTYFWSVRNLSPIPDETYSRPFEETSYYTAFALTEKGEDDGGVWGDMAYRFYDTYLKDADLNDKQCKKLGLNEFSKNDSIDFSKTDNLYTAIKKYFTLEKFNSVFPVNKDIDDLFDSKKGDASDLAILMYTILKKWNQDVKTAWIRDLREGTFNINIPTITWFNRLGVLVKINGSEKFYDFDRCITNNYKTPWFISGVKIMVLDKEFCYEKALPELSDFNNNFISESHILKLNSNSVLTDTLAVIYRGSKAESYRDELYELEENEVTNKIKENYTTSCFKEITNLTVNNFYDDDSIKIDLSGQPLIQPEVLDSFIVFKIKCNLIREFNSKIYSTTRHTDFQFESPFSFKMHWKIVFPQGYKLKESLPEKTTLLSPVKAFTQLNYKFDRQIIDINADILFRERIIPAANFKDLIDFLNRSVKAIEKDIIFTKI